MRRPGRRIAVLAAIAALVATVPACRRSSGGGAPVPAAVAGDSARGIVEVVGADPISVVALAVAGGERVALRGPEADRLRPLAGLDVAVAGPRAIAEADAAPRPGRAIVVATFIVHGVNGIPAVDGVVAADGNRFFLVTSDGRRLEAPYLPDALRARVGSRAYVAGPLTGPAHAYGLIPDR